MRSQLLPLVQAPAKASGINGLAVIRGNDLPRSPLEQQGVSSTWYSEGLRLTGHFQTSGIERWR